MKNFYTAGEAQERLGLTKSAFFHLVRKGTLKKVTMPGKKQGVYPKSEIDQFAATIKTLIEQYERETSTFELATPDDLPIEYGIDMSLYGRKGTTPLESRYERLEANPEGNYVLRNGGVIVGHMAFYPVEKDHLMLLLDNKVRGIPADKILPWKVGEPLQIFIVIISVKRGFPPDVEKHYGLRLLAGAVNVFKQLGERGVIIENIYATSRTTQGVRLARKLGMEEQEYQDEPGRYRFSLNMQTSDSLLVQEYQLGLAESQQ
jgi:hypothetical protein